MSILNDEDDSLLLEKQLCFALHHAARSIAKVYKETLQRAGVTYPQYLVLITLLQDEKLSASDICNRLHLDSGTVTPLLKRMEANGHLTRVRMPHDGAWSWSSSPTADEVCAVSRSTARAEVVRRLGRSDRDILRLRSQLVFLTVKLEG